MAFLMPIGFYILFGYMLQNVEFSGSSLSDLLIPLYIIIIIGNAVISVFGTFYVQARESGNLQKFKFMGVSELCFSFTLFVATFAFQLIVIVAFIVFTYFYKGTVFPVQNIIPVLATLAVIEIFHFAVTFLLTSILRKASIYNPISLAFYMFQMFLGGLTFPIEMFPQFLQKLVYYINPVIYGRNALLAAWTGNSAFGSVIKDNVILLAISALLVIAAVCVQRFIFSQKTSAALAQ
jgi:ABC-2 type transport system permease protein